MKSWIRHPIFSVIEVTLTTPIKSANETLINPKYVYLYITALSVSLKDGIRKRFLSRFYNTLCGHCSKPVLEHSCNITRDGEEIVQHWAGNCAIGPLQRKRKLYSVE